MRTGKLETGTRIVTAAADLFSRKSYADVSVAEVAEKAGCTKVTVYQHFASKDQLVIACLRMRLERRESQLEEFVNQLQAHVDPLLAIFDWLGDWLDPADFRGCAFVKAVNELSSVLPEVREIASEAKERIARRFTALARKTGRCRAQELGQQLALVFEGAQSLALIQVSAKPAELAHRIAATILGGWGSCEGPAAKANHS